MVRFGVGGTKLDIYTMDTGKSCEKAYFNDVLNWLEQLAFSPDDPAKFATFLPPSGIIIHFANAAKVPVMKRLIDRLFILARNKEK
jgi:hypothetical protein